MSGWETRLSSLEGLSAEEKGFVTCKLLLLDDDAKAARFFVGDDKATVNILKGLLPQAGGGTQDALVKSIEELKIALEAGLKANQQDIQALKAGQQAIQEVVAERASQTRQASKIKEAELRELKAAQRFGVVWSEEDPPLESLLGPRPSEDPAIWWDEDVSEPAQRQACAEELNEHIPFRRGPGQFQLHDVKGTTVKKVFEGLPYPMAGRNDELISLRRHHGDPSQGGIIGVELKKKLGWATVRQAVADFVLYATDSWYPYCQVATDFETGGIALYMSGRASGMRIITGRVFQGMPSFWNFFTSWLNSIPEDVGSDERLVVDELPEPKRMRFHWETQRGDGSASRVHDTLRALARFYNNWGDVANEADLHGFNDPDIREAIPPEDMPPYII